MTIAHSAQAIYAQARSVRTPREIERELFALITARMRQARAKPAAWSMPERAAALDQNRRLWEALALDLALPNNQLPLALRGQLLSLARFVLLSIPKILQGGPDQDELFDALIDINAAILRGLSETGISAPPRAVGGQA